MDPIILASGQHRVIALKKMAQSYLDDEARMEKHMKHLEDISDISKEDVEEDNGLCKHLVAVQCHLNIMGLWGMILYDKTLHIYHETQEEKLVSTLCNMYNAYVDEGKQGALKVFEGKNAKLSNKKNSKLTKVLKNQHLMLNLMVDILQFGPHYQTRCKLSMYTQYMCKSVVLFQQFTSKDNFPSVHKVCTLAEDSDTNKDMNQCLDDLSNNILSAKPGEINIFIPHMEDINEIAMKSRNMVPMSLMTGIIMDHVWMELESVQEGYKEISHWFEPLIDMMKGHEYTMYYACSHTSSVLQLHNSMALIVMQRKMGTQLRMKDDFITKWKAMPESMHQSTKALYDMMKKLLGKGLAPQGIQKHTTQEVLPSIQAIIIENEFADTYQPEILTDHMVWRLCLTLKENMMTSQHHLKLKSATAGSLANQRKWTFGNRVDVPEPEVEMDLPQNEDTQKAQYKTNHCIVAEKADRDTILKL
ncbi:hypothetical protein BDR05DRAFT_947605 [Suillus weaverae]|nr:hypothetical protein BDR05DRAFT_947605 [Suillus weaverae]